MKALACRKSNDPNQSKLDAYLKGAPRNTRTTRKKREFLPRRDTDHTEKSPPAEGCRNGACHVASYALLLWGWVLFPNHWKTVNHEKHKKSQKGKARSPSALSAGEESFTTGNTDHTEKSPPAEGCRNGGVGSLSQLLKELTVFFLTIGNSSPRTKTLFHRTGTFTRTEYQGVEWGSPPLHETP